ncbi:MAG: ribosome silencing factor [Firmicutes bacterium ZCTH02-B6]|nr:MAG: ribosome silencing factor [Firmicutes bacterium ZCTH02-B6]
MTEREAAIRAAQAADEKKADQVVILDMRPLTVVTDYFVICSGQSQPQVRAIARGIEEAMEQEGVPLRRREGDDRSRWILLDFGGVVVHVFHHAEREYYDLERLWADAPRVEWSPVSSTP